MQRKLQKLLRIQVLLMLLPGVIAWIAGCQDWLSGLFAGGLTAIMTTIMAMLIFRRLPKVVPASMFYKAMVLNQVMKWLLVMAIGALVIPYVVPLGFVVGFIVTYLAYFGLILID